MLSNHPNCLGGNGPSASSDLLGDVDGPASATDNAVARFDGTTGKLIQNSAVTVSDAAANNVTIEAAAATNLTLTGGSTGASLVLGQGASGNATLVSPGTFLLYNTANTTGLANFITFGANNRARVGGIIEDSTTGAEAIRLYSGNTASGAVERARVSSGGNLLIGTATDMSGSGGVRVTGGNIELTTAAKAFFQTSSQSKFGDASGVVTGGSGTDTAIGYFSSGKLIFGITGGTEKARLTDTGNLLIGGTTDIPGSGGLKVFGTTAASSTTTGALQVAGGVGVAGAGYFGGAVLSGAQYVITGNGSVPTASTIAVGTNGAGSRMLLNVPSAAEINFNVNGSLVSAISSTRSFFATQVMESINSTASTGAGTGALQVAGGIYAGAASVFGGNLTVGNSNTNQLLTIQSATAGTGQGAALVLKNNTTTIGFFGRSSYISSGAVNTDAPALGATTGLGLNFFVNDSTNALALASTGAATFAGAVTASTSGNTALSVFSTDAATGNPFVRVGYNSNLSGQLSNDAATGKTYLDSRYNDVTSAVIIRTKASGTPVVNATFDSTGAATFAGSVITPAATTAISSVRLPHGTAPTSPVNGDMWTTTAGLYVRINGVTVGPLS